MKAITSGFLCECSFLPLDAALDTFFFLAGASSVKILRFIPISNVRSFCKSRQAQG